MYKFNFGKKFIVTSTVVSTTTLLLFNSRISSKFHRKHFSCCDHSANTYPANNPTEDRYVAINPSKTSDWLIGAVFDGHGNILK